MKEGDLDFRGTLGVDKGAPVGVKAFRLTFEIDTDAPQDKIEQFLKLTECYCMVFQTLNSKLDLSVEVKRWPWGNERRRSRVLPFDPILWPVHPEGFWNRNAV